MTSNDEPFQELPLRRMNQVLTWDADATLIATLTVSIDKVGGTIDIAKSKTQDLSSSAAKKSLNEKDTKNPAMKYTEVIELKKLNKSRHCWHKV